MECPELLDWPDALSGQHRTNRLDLLIRERREISQRSFADLFALTIGLTEQVGRPRSAIGDAIDVHDHTMTYLLSTVNIYNIYYMGTYCILNDITKKARALQMQGSSLQGSFQMRWNFRLMTSALLCRSAFGMLCGGCLPSHGGTQEMQIVFRI